MLFGNTLGKGGISLVIWGFREAWVWDALRLLRAAHAMRRYRHSANVLGFGRGGLWGLILLGGFFSASYGRRWAASGGGLGLDLAALLAAAHAWPLPAQPPALRGGKGVGSGWERWRRDVS